MKRILLGIIAINLTFIISSASYADDHIASNEESIKACGVVLKRNSIEGIENCNKGDILRVNGRKASAWKHLEFQAMACLPETIYMPETTGVVDYICEYRGRLLDLVQPD